MFAFRFGFRFKVEFGFGFKFWFEFGFGFKFWFVVLEFIII